MAWLLNVLYLLGLVLLSPYLLYRAIRTGRYLGSLWTRITGGVPQGIPHGAVWFHGVSVGEIHLLRQVVSAFRARFPGKPVVVSSTTDTGLAEARKAFPDLPVLIFPLDFSWAVHRVLATLQPSLVVLAECELWPNFLLACRGRGIPTAIINARMSPRSFARYRALGGPARWLLNLPEMWIVQHETFALGLNTLGVPPERVQVGGAIKFDGALGDRNNPRTQAMGQLLAIEPGEAVWVVGSTQAPEEEAALEIWLSLRAEGREPRLILVPRQTDRFEVVARLLDREGVTYSRRTQLKAGDPVASVILVDTIGELNAVWGLADIAFVGGSLDGRRGGQNMLEPAGYGAAVIFGPHVWNFATIARSLVDAAGAVQVQDVAALRSVVLRLLANPIERKALALAARQFIQLHQGAVQRHLNILAPLCATDAIGSEAA